MSKPVVYLDPSSVIAKRQTEAPRNRSSSGYGNKIPTSWLLQLASKRWHRVYVIQWSNAGSAYIRVKGELVFLGSYDPRNMTKKEALDLARTMSSNGRKHVVRESFGTYHVCPLYEPGREGLTADAGYSSLGVLVKESL